jgi:IS30 family transposase
MGREKGWMHKLTGRPAMRSPGRPAINQRHTRRAFWERIAAGLQSEEAALACGVSQPLGPRWFREAGGVPPTNLGTPSGRYLSFAEREELAILHAQQVGVREIARRLGRSPSTISRELRRNAATRAGKLQYRATVAQWKAERAAQRPKIAKLAHNEALRTYVQDRLAGHVQDERGKRLAGPLVPWKGRRHGRRADRRWGKGWSPEQISQRLVVDFPDDASMRVSHEAIYQALYIQGRGALKRELTACLRTGRALRVPQARTRQRGRQFIPPELMISERPAEIEDRAVPGHWEGDLIIGLNRSAIGTLVERTTRFTMLLHLPPMPGHQTLPYVKNGPALAGRGAEAVRDAIALKIAALPTHLSKSLTWDQGAEMAQHVQLRSDTGLQIYFCDPRSPWQRGTNENTNGLLRQYFPKGTDLSRYAERELAGVAATLNARPRKTLGWRTPAEALEELLSPVRRPGVATTP